MGLTHPYCVALCGVPGAPAVPGPKQTPRDVLKRKLRNRLVWVPLFWTHCPVCALPVPGLRLGARTHGVEAWCSAAWHLAPGLPPAPSTQWGAPVHQQEWRWLRRAFPLAPGVPTAPDLPVGGEGDRTSVLRGEREAVGSPSREPRGAARSQWAAGRCVWARECVELPPGLGGSLGAGPCTHPRCYFVSSCGGAFVPSWPRGHGPVTASPRPSQPGRSCSPR